ncbi:MAG: efflux RND transporter permease subunit [Candidatus Syntrophosphaera sp.]|nr:efflux RND transporter permease subunit [Candidatus Syntrophosphaera sp.]
MFLSDLSIRRPILVAMAILVFVVFGILAYFSLPLNLMPDISLPYIVIQTIYPGAGPSEVETQVTKRIEDSIATVSLVDFTQSYSMDNASIILVAFKMQKDIDIANQEIKDKVDGIIRELPANTEKPIVMKLDINARPFMDVILSGNMDGRALYELADTKLRDRFGQIEGVGQVSITGGNKRQIEVRLKDSVVFENRISLAQLMQILAAQNLDMPAGNFQKGSQEYSVHLRGQFENVEKIADAKIPTAFGAKRLGDIAAVIDGQEEVRSRSIYYEVASGQIEENIVLISLTNAPDGNVVSISEEVMNELPVMREELPAGVNLDVVKDNSDFINGTVTDTFSNILLGILLTGILLLIFLHDFRSTIIVALSMPVSIISTFMFMQIFGFSFNMMTLIGITTSVGILVTNSIVVIENIFRHKDMGNDGRTAASLGTSEIAISIVASTLTNIVVFLPIATMGSLVGVFFREYALTVAIATVFSLIMAFTLTPMLASRILPEKRRKNRFGVSFDRGFAKFAGLYQRFLTTVLASKKHSRNIIFGVIGVLILSFALLPVIGLEFMPNLDMGEMSLSIELPQGYNLEQTAQVYDEIHTRLGKHKEIQHMITTLGSSGFVDSGTNIGSSSIKLVDKSQRKVNARQLAGQFSQELADIPNAKIKVSAESAEIGGATGGIEFYLQGQDNQRLEQIKNEILQLIDDTPGIMNLDTSTRAGRPELTIIPKRDEMAAVGATVYDLALALRASVEGMVSTQYTEGDNKYDIKISLEDDAVDSPDKLRNLSVVIFGQPYLLSQLAEIDFGEGANRITHRDRSKTIIFTADVAEGSSLGDVVASINERIGDLELPSGYKIVWGGMADMLSETIKAMLQAFILAMLLTYMLLSAILESLVQPIFIMGTIPMALIGVILALLISGQSLNIVSMMSIIVLVGIVVNNAILLLDYANQRRKRGISPHDALLEAGEAKLKPIIISTLSIVIGMLPMALGLGSSGKEMRMPMGIVIIGGLIVSTFLTLVIIPAFYYLTSKQVPAKGDSN